MPCCSRDFQLAPVESASDFSQAIIALELATHDKHKQYYDCPWLIGVIAQQLSPTNWVIFLVLLHETVVRLVTLMAQSDG